MDDGFIHYQLLRFCQATRLQYLNGQISIRNQNSLQQQHVDRKIADALLKKGTKGAYTSWTQQDRAWVTGGTNQGPAYYQECVSLFGKKVFMKPVNE